MQYIKFYATVILFCGTLWCHAQETRYQLNGVVTDQQGFPLQGATVKAGNLTAITDSKGRYVLEPIREQRIRVDISSVGFKPFSQSTTLKADKNTLDAALESQTESLEVVEVLGRTKVQEVNRQAYNVTAVDATKLYNSTLDISGALDRVAGIRVRESGGLGSNFNLSLNGFSGTHIRYFIDGVPMESFGSSFQINNIPINIAERIEVYKGVVPTWLSSDALGGAVNIVTGDRYQNFVDASYSYGSFNTHRTVINTSYTSRKGVTFRLNAYQNYSDNNYKVTVDAADINTGAYTQNMKLRRFHDTYHNEVMIANIGLVGQRFADQLLAGIVLGQNYKEIQTGARMVSVFGGWHRRGTTLMPTITYKKRDLIKGLDLTLNANYNFGWEQNIDTVNARFDWYGNSRPTYTNSGERSRTMYKYRDNEGLANTIANYQITDRHGLSLSNNFKTFRRNGHDEMNPTNALYETEKRSVNNVSSLGYSYDIREKWSASVFGRLLVQMNKDGVQGLNTVSNMGYGFASAYFFNPDLQVKLSYERTNRMPSAYDLFGDLENQEGNANLRPEKSHNVNLGTYASFDIAESHQVSLTANAIYRRAFDYIYYRLNNNQSRTIADNRDGVETYGGDAELRYSFRNWFLAGATVTYQRILNTQKYEDGFSGISPLYRDQMPNIPFLFGNADASVIFRDVAKKGNNLNIGYNLNYVHAFYLYWPSRGGDKLDIPKQLSHDLNLVYSMQNGRYNISLEARNLTDTRIYDNFSLQKPSRGFYVNVRYFFNKLPK